MATAEALILLANACAIEAQALQATPTQSTKRNLPNAILGGVQIFEIVH